jgi:hypothetical protein
LKRVDPSKNRKLFNNIIIKHKKEENNSLNIAWNVLENQNGVVLGGFLKTRNIDLINKDKKQFIFRLKSSWKLRYWTLRMTDEGLILEKSRRPDTKPYKSILLPFNETSFWENWGKRGDNKYRFGFTLRVARNKMQMDVAVDSDRTRLQWMNVLDLVFGDNIRNMKELLKCLADRECSNLQSTKSLSEVTNDFKYGSGRGLKVRNVNGSNTDSISQSFETLIYAAHSPVIPRRFSSDVYDDDGYMSDNLERNRFFYFKSVLPKIADKESDDNEDGFDDNGNCVLTATDINTPPKSCVSDDHTSNSCCHSLPEMITTITKNLIDEIGPTSESSSESNQSVSVSEQNSIHLPENILNILNGVGQTSNEDKQPIQLVSPTPSSFTLAQKMEEITPNDNIDMQLNVVVGHESNENNTSYEVGMVIA